MAKIGFQIQGIAPELNRALEKKPISIKLLGNALNLGLAQFIKQKSPTTLIVLRFTGGDQSFTDNPTQKAQAFAAEAARAFAPFREAGVCDLVEGINEPIIRNAVEAQQLNAWQVAYANRMRALGFRVGAYCFSVGNPDYPLWPYLYDGLRASDYLFLHEYGAPTLQAGAADLALRHRKVYALLPSDCRKPLAITECGIDGGVIGRGGGYKKFTTIDDYLNQLSWYDAELQKDGYVHFAHVFLYGRSDDRWLTFDVAEGDEERAKFINWLGSGVVLPPPPIGGIVTRITQPTKEMNEVTAKLKVYEPRPGEDSFWGLTGFSYVLGVSAGCAVVVQDFEGAKMANVSVINLRPDGKYEAVATNADGKANFNYGPQSAFTPPAEGPFTVYVGVEGTQDIPIHYSDRVYSLGDYRGSHTDYEIVFRRFKVGDKPPPPPPPPPPPSGGFVFPAVLSAAGARGEAGTPIPGKPFYRLSPQADVRTGVSAFCAATVYQKNGIPAIGAQVVNIRPADNNKGEIGVADGNGRVQFNYGPGSAFSTPGEGPYTVFVAEGAIKDEETKVVTWALKLSDTVRSLGDFAGAHKEIYMQFVEQQPIAPPPPPGALKLDGLIAAWTQLVEAAGKVNDELKKLNTSA